MSIGKRKGGCLGCFGLALTLIGGLILLFSTFMIYFSEKEMDKNRKLYAESMERYEQMQHPDSIAVYGEPSFEPEGHIGFNIVGGILIVPAFFGFILFGMGILLLIIRRIRKREIEHF